MGPLSLIDTYTTSDRDLNWPQLVRCLLHHLLCPLTWLENFIDALFIYWYICMLHVICAWMEWQSHDITSLFSRDCSQTLSLSVDLFAHLVYSLVFGLLSSECFWSFSPNSHALSHLPSHFRGSDWSEYMVWKFWILWGDLTNFCAEYHFRLSL